MRLDITLTLMLSVVFAPLPASAQPAVPFDHRALARQALEGHIRPGYSRLADAARGLGNTVEKSCLATSATDRNEMERAFDVFVDAWGRVEHIDFGPVTGESRLEKILFWPDRRGIGARQVAKILADRDPSLLDPVSLGKKSVAVQGLGALESALFPDWAKRPADDRAFRCGYALAIASNLKRVALEIVEAWSERGAFAKSWLTAGPGNSNFVTPTETTLALAKAFDQGIERARDQRIAGPLGLTPQRVKSPAVLSRSGRTMRLVDANIKGLIDLFRAGGLQSAIVATGFKTRELDASLNADLVARELTTAEETAVQLITAARPFEGANAQRLVAIGFPLKNARVQLGALLVETAGLTLGFNASDGD